MIKVIYNKVCGRCVQSEPLTSGMVGQPIHFEYSHDFDGLAVTAVFTDGKNTVDVVNPGNECIIPHEVLSTPGATVSVGIYAVNGDTLIIPTVYATIGIVLKGADPSGDVSIDPTLPVWAQIQGIIGNLNDLDTEAKNNLVAAINEAAQTGSGGGGSASIAMRVDGGYIQYSTDKGKTWVNLIAEADLKGDKGDPGIPGKDGHSPVVTATKSGKTTTISVDGTAIATVEDGTDGAPGVAGTPGKDGTSITISGINESAADGGTNTVTFSDGSALKVKNGSKGSTGADGTDGITPHIGDNGNWYLGATDTGKPSRGAAGSAGQAGKDGKSAYQYAQEGGYTGTEAEFATKLAEEMPDKLPNPNALTFTGAATGTYDGSAPLNVEIPSGGASGGGSAFSPQLIAKLVADGTTTSILQNIDVAYPAIYTVAISGSGIADTENAGQYLFAKFGASNMYTSSVDVRGIQTENNNYTQQFVAVTFALDSEKRFHVIGKAESKASNTSNWMNTPDGTKISTNAIFFYSSTSKTIPAGFTCSVWRWA